MPKRKVGKLTASPCPKCGTYMDKTIAWVCSKCGMKTKK